MSIGKCFKLRETLPRGPVTVIERELTSNLTPSGMSTVPVLTMVFIAGQPASEGAGSGPVSRGRARTRQTVLKESAYSLLVSKLQ